MSGSTNRPIIDLTVASKVLWLKAVKRLILYTNTLFSTAMKNDFSKTHSHSLIQKTFTALITFRVSRRRREMYCGHSRLCVCLSVCLSAAACLHYCTDPDVTWGRVVGMPPSCALLGGFAIGARVALLWQHNTNAKC